ncbi:MAG: GNAT family N-acetyltransferase [Chloroflexi bacterium]|nr:GNAT family N-acetyltransferase [Chloroflexota bacterium]
MNQRQRIAETQTFPLRNVPLRPRDRERLLQKPGTVHLTNEHGEMMLVAWRGQYQLYWAYSDLESMRTLFPKMWTQIRKKVDPDQADHVQMDLVEVHNRDWLDPMLNDADFFKFAEWMEMVQPDLDPANVPEFPDGVTMRRATDDDLDAFSEIWSDAYGDLNDGARAFEAMVEEVTWAGALEHDGKVVAFAMNGAVDGSEGEILAACVAPDAWGNGYGRLVLAAAAYRHASQGAVRARIKVRPDIKPALKTCADLGFRFQRAGIEYRRPVDEEAIRQAREERRVVGVKARFGGWR